MLNSLISLLILTHAQGLGKEKAKKLIQDFGGADPLIEAGYDPHARVLFKKYKILDWETDHELVHKNGIEVLSFDDPRYPNLLLEQKNFPLLLYVKGKFLKTTPSIAVIGTRNATQYGIEAARTISREISQADVSVVSGLARGIDTAAHMGALSGHGKTIAVLGSGICNLYPRENQKLADQIAEEGSLISEYPMQTPPGKNLFPQRNRIISGMSLGCCLIESPLQGGGMLTMHIAETAKKPLFALPGRIDVPTFEGNHFLIKEKKAKLIVSGNDILKDLKMLSNCITPEPHLPLLTREEMEFLKCMPQEEKTIDELVLLTQLPIMQLNVFLTRLVLKKVIKELPGKIFKKEIAHG